MWFYGEEQISSIQYPSWQTKETNIRGPVLVKVQLGRTLRAELNYTFDPTGHYLIVYLGATYDYIQPTFVSPVADFYWLTTNYLNTQLKIIQYTPEFVQPNIASFGFLNAAISTINLNIDVATEVPGLFNFQVQAFCQIPPPRGYRTKLTCPS